MVENNDTNMTYESVHKVQVSLDRCTYPIKCTATDTDPQTVAFTFTFTTQTPLTCVCSAHLIWSSLTPWYDLLQEFMRRHGYWHISTSSGSRPYRACERAMEVKKGERKKEYYQQQDNDLSWLSSGWEFRKSKDYLSSCPIMFLLVLFEDDSKPNQEIHTF
jgi:hypothetical protein